MGDFFKNITSSKVMKNNNNNNSNSRGESEKKDSAPGGFFNFFGKGTEESSSSGSRRGNNRINDNSRGESEKKDSAPGGFFNFFGKGTPPAINLLTPGKPRLTEENTSSSRSRSSSNSNSNRKNNKNNKNSKNMEEPFEIPLGVGIMVVLLLLLGLLFYFGRRIWDYLTSKATFFLPVGGETKKCPTGCHVGKCKVGEGDCKEDAECNMCEDESGTFYASVESDTRPEKVKSAEDQIAADMRLRKLESTIEERNREIQKLNRYIETVNHDRLQAEILLKKTLETTKRTS